MKAVRPSDLKGKTKSISPLKIRQAVVALKLGPGDEAVLKYMDFLSAYIPVGSVYFIHVLPKFDLFNALYEKEQESLVSDYQLNQEVIQRMEGKIQSSLTNLDAHLTRFDVREGDPLEELLKDVEDIAADLVVIGQKNGASEHGILARNLARKITCNALVVPENAKTDIRRILVPIDFSPDSIDALQTALALRQRLEPPVTITCVNVFDMPNFSLYRIQKTRKEVKKMLEEDRQEAFRAFLKTYAPEEEENIETVLIEREHPGIANYLLDYAEETGCDFIVMGARGHSKVELLLLGSVTEKLLSSNEQVPTLIVKGKGIG
jgi:nucleotide-binding universal stress UspA family protein